MSITQAAQPGKETPAGGSDGGSDGGSASGSDIGSDGGSDDVYGGHFALHEDRIPGNAEGWLEELYGSLYSSLPQLQLAGLAGVSTYVDLGRLRQPACPAAVFLYRRQRHALHVINEGMRLDAAVAERFARRMFDRHRELRSVHWHAITITGKPAGLPAFCFDCSEDIVLALPATEAAYLDALGKATRKSLRQRLARAPGLVHRVVAGADVAPGTVDRIISFNHARMAAKSRRSALDGAAAAGLQRLLRERGLVGLTWIDGQLGGGTLACRIANDVYSLVNAHDPVHDRLGLGNLCRHLMIVEAIRTGAHRFHLLGGNYASKKSCLARRITLQHVVLHRDRRRRLADAPTLARLGLMQAELRARRWLDDARHRHALTR